jgi:hypothetical protein
MIGRFSIRYGVVNGSVKVDDVMGAGIMLIPGAVVCKEIPGTYSPLAADSHPVQDNSLHRSQGTAGTGVPVYC